MHCPLVANRKTRWSIEPILLFKFFYKRTVRLKRLDKDPQEAYFRQKKKEDQFSDLLEVDQLFLRNGRRQIAADGPLHRNFGVKEKRLL